MERMGWVKSCRVMVVRRVVEIDRRKSWGLRSVKCRCQLVGTGLEELGVAVPPLPAVPASIPIQHQIPCPAPATASPLSL